MNGRLWSAVALALVLLVGCVKAHPDTAVAGFNVVREDDIEALHAASAYDVVARTHAEYLHSRGRESSPDPRVAPIPADVYVDDTFYGGVSTLRGIPASQLAEVRFFQGYEAQYKFGSGHMGGVIQVITKR
jgi:hypothetical protein